MQECRAEYCSRNLTPYIPICTIGKGIEVIETILAKAVLCRHDVNKINKVYRKFEHLEKQSSQILNFNSHCVLEKIVEKIEKIAAEKNLFGLVSLYHLQGFLDKDLHLEKHFLQIWSQVGKNPQLFKQMAAYLSCCHSGQKRGKPQNYPPFFHELLENGYLHLYDHLMHMRTLTNRMSRQEKIQKIPFSHLSYIILETREAILQKVKNAIRGPFSNILFLLGATGAGKSTTLCFLRGDTMVQKNFCYQSKSDENSLIGDHIAASCTFLPTIQTINGWIIVDFPGFEDTNGPLISLGMEFALKALIKDYHPKVLVLESITNIEAATELGLRLKRIFRNQEDCLLGITKYSKDPDFIEIKNIEAEQRKERLKPSQVESELIKALQKATEEELELVGALECPVDDGHSEDSIEGMEQELAEWQQKKENITQELAILRQKSLPVAESALPDTPMKEQRKKNIEEKENVLREQIGIKDFFSFKHLSDPSRVSLCFQALSEMKPIHESFENRLDAEHERVLKDCFENDLKDQLINKNTDFQLDIQNTDALKNSILKSSFISTIYSQSHSEIGRLLHLPEMNLNIVREFDKKVVEDCIMKIIKVVIQTYDLSLSENILEEVKGKIPQENIDEFQEKLIRLQDFILILLKGEQPTTKADTKEKWAILQKKYQTAIDKIGMETLSDEILFNNGVSLAFHIGCFVLPWGIPALGMIYLLVWLGKQTDKEKVINQMIKSHSKSLDQLYDILLKLNYLEKIIVKQDEIDKAFKSVEIETDSIESLDKSIKDRISQVRQIYGCIHWDKRVAFLKKKFELLVFNETSFLCLPAYAYLLIEPALSYEITINKLSRSHACCVKYKFIINKKANLTNTIRLIREYDKFPFLKGFGNFKQTEFGFEIYVAIKYYTDGLRDEFNVYEPENLRELFNESLLVNRALYADAFLKANEM